MKEIPRHKTVVEGHKRWIYYDRTSVCLYRMFIKKGTTHRVYTPGDEAARYLEQEGEIADLNTVTIIPSPGYIRIHSSGISRPLEWPGSDEIIGGGVVPLNMEFDYEGVENSFWYCVAGPADWAFRKEWALVRYVVTPEDPFVFTDKTHRAICMYGDHETKCFSGEPGDVLEVSRKTLVAAMERRDV